MDKKTFILLNTKGSKQAIYHTLIGRMFGGISCYDYNNSYRDIWNRYDAVINFYDSQLYYGYFELHICQKRHQSDLPGNTTTFL